MITLVCGPPDQRKKTGRFEEAGATFSRFVLPFAYRLTPLRSRWPDGPVYRRVSPGRAEEMWKSRVKYFAVETADVLYHRAAWFRLEGLDGDAAETVLALRAGRHGGRETVVAVRVSSVYLVLFECPQCPNAGTVDPEAFSEPVHTGMLIVETHFLGPDDPLPPGCEVSDEVVRVRPRFCDLLRWNEAFRYWRPPFDEHAEKMRGLMSPGIRPFPPWWDDRLDTIGLYLERWEYWLSRPVVVGDEVFRVVPETWLATTRNRVREPVETVCPGGTTSQGWDVYADDRAFVWTCAVVRETPGIHPFWETGLWVKLLNADWAAENEDSRLLPASAFEKEWVRPRTYLRWAGLGSLYGFCYHAAAAWVPPIGDPPLVSHFRWLYFDMVLLLFYMRVVLFRFSTAIAGVSAEAVDRSHRRWRHTDVCKDKWFVDRFKRMRTSFMLFTNMYQFPLLSNQQQAIEMYEIARRAMDIDDLFRELDKEIQVSHEFELQQSSRDVGERALLLTVVGMVGLILGTATGLLGMNVPGASDVSGGGMGWGAVKVLGGVTLVMALFYGLVTLCSVGIGRCLFGLVEFGRDPRRAWVRIRGGMARRFR